MIAPSCSNGIRAKLEQSVQQCRRHFAFRKIVVFIQPANIEKIWIRRVLEKNVRCKVGIEHEGHQLSIDCRADPEIGAPAIVVQFRDRRMLPFWFFRLTRGVPGSADASESADGGFSSTGKSDSMFP